MKIYMIWIDTLLKKQKSCFVNGGTTTLYFKSGIFTRQGDLISAYLFFFFEHSRKQNNQNKTNNAGYAGHITFFLSGKKSVMELMKILTFIQFFLLNGFNY